MDEKTYGPAHRFSVKERRQSGEIGFVFDGVEEGNAVLDDKIEVGDEGSEALGKAMSLEIERDGSEAHLSEKDGSGLEGPADVVPIAVDHTDDGTGRRVKRQPSSGEEGKAPGRGVEGFGRADAFGSVIFCF
ncbi:hypothetical protein H6P81_005609 [Aristolochia fimbriata]|uniref:Uncharacterized protein n=1 Tax=Aristolochia fimbriata TaxID=158543 RepID=A0AAV7EUX8_ARIFI|nr:hypothetical protein H6P81_005609 [Aristolochia fimbriata]